MIFNIILLLLNSFFCYYSIIFFYFKIKTEVNIIFCTKKIIKCNLFRIYSKKPYIYELLLNKLTNIII